MVALAAAGAVTFGAADAVGTFGSDDHRRRSAEDLSTSDGLVQLVRIVTTTNGDGPSALPERQPPPIVIAHQSGQTQSIRWTSTST